MGETDLSEIENRIEQYPPQARHDILRLTQELRRLHELSGQRKHAKADSPLYDSLTGLLNGGAYGVRFSMARARATRYRKIFAVLSVDVTVTGSDGALRQRMIREVAERLENCVRATDTLARIGDENFAIILEDLGQAPDAERVKQNVQDALARPIGLDDDTVKTKTQVHMRFYPENKGAGNQLYH